MGGNAEDNSMHRAGARAQVVGPDPTKNFFVATWTRAKFDPSRFPQSLNCLAGKAHLDNFDSHAGNLWRFKFIEGSERLFTLACMNLGPEVVFLSGDLSVVKEEVKAQVWEWTPYRPFRGNLPSDISIQIRTRGGEMLLCSDERSRSVCLLAPKEANFLDPRTGEHAFNEAWEITADEEIDEELLMGLLVK